MTLHTEIATVFGYIGKWFGDRKGLGAVATPRSVKIRLKSWLEERQMLPNVIEDGRAFRYAANAGLALIFSILVTWVFDSAFDSPIANAFLHLPVLFIFGALFLLSRQRTARYRLAEQLYFAGLAYGASFLPWSLYLYDPGSDFAFSQGFAGALLLLFIYPMRTAVLCLLLGLAPALLVGGVAWLGGRTVHEPNINVLLLAYLPVWLTLRTYTDRTTKDKVFAVKYTTDTIAHEMRTPMLSIEASCEAMRQVFKRFLAKTLTPEQHENIYTQMSVRTMNKAINRIDDEMTRMQHNINLLLQNASSPKSIPTDTKAIQSIAEILHANVSKYPFYSGTDLENIKLVTTADFPVWISPVMFEHVITNLLKNSLHSLQKAGKGEILIEVGRAAGNGSNIIRFRDTGSGMTPASLAQIFTPFYTTRSNGNGLGLAFCRKALALFGADITADSVENEFAEFTISFPNAEHRIPNASTFPPDDNDSRR